MLLVLLHGSAFADLDVVLGDLREVELLDLNRVEDFRKSVLAGLYEFLMGDDI